MTLFLLLYTHAACAMLGYMLYDWSTCARSTGADYAKDLAAVIFLALVWPLPLYVILREGVRK